MTARRLTTKDVLICLISLLSLCVLAKVSGFTVWSLMEIGGSGIVIAGCWGEYMADFSRLISKSEPAKEFVSKCSTLFLIVGLVIELAGFFANLQISERIAVSQHLAIGMLKDRASSNELQTFRLSLSLEEAKSNNLILRSNVVALEVRSRWREITQEQKDDFIESTRNINKFGIRIRFATHDAEVQSFAAMIREMLDSAGFAETNAEPLGEWPPGMNILYRGGGKGWQMPSLMFLNNVEVTNAPVQPNGGIDKVFYVLATNAMIYADEFWAIIAQTNTFQMTLGDGDVAIVLEKANYAVPIPAHSARQILFRSDPNVRKLWDFLKIRAVFYSMGITTEWMTNTNLSLGTCEIFVNPKL